MLSTDGLLQIPKGFGGVENITEARYPDLIKDLAYNPVIHRVVMEYDSDNNGIVIHRLVVTDGTHTSYFYDLRSGGLFPETYPEEAAFFSSLDFEADDPSDSGLIVGSKDGYLRRWLSTAKSDDAGASDEAIDAYVGFGPLATSPTVRKTGRVSGIDIVTGGDGDGGAGDSSNVYCEVYTATNAQKLITDMVAGTSPKYTKTLKSPGQVKGNVDRRKVKGRYIGTVIGNSTAAQSFAFEQLNMNGV